MKHFTLVDRAEFDQSMIALCNMMHTYFSSKPMEYKKFRVASNTDAGLARTEVVDSLLIVFRDMQESLTKDAACHLIIAGMELFHYLASNPDFFMQDVELKSVLAGEDLKIREDNAQLVDRLNASIRHNKELVEALSRIREVVQEFIKPGEDFQLFQGTAEEFQQQELKAPSVTGPRKQQELGLCVPAAKPFPISTSRHIVACLLAKKTEEELIQAEKEHDLDTGNMDVCDMYRDLGATESMRLRLIYNVLRDTYCPTDCKRVQLGRDLREYAMLIRNACKHVRHPVSGMLTRLAARDTRDAIWHVHNVQKVPS